jgi:hypothetical protein
MKPAPQRPTEDPSVARKGLSRRSFRAALPQEDKQ